MYKVNMIDNDLIQLYGSVVNGFIYKKEVIGSLKKVYAYSLTLHINRRLIKVQSGDNDGTMTTLKKALERIDNIILKEKEWLKWNILN